MTHELKTHMPYFEAVASEDKKFEVRLNDRNFKYHDILKLKEYDQNNERYTGREVTCYVSYILKGGQFGIDEKYCVMAIAGLSYNF